MTPPRHHRSTSPYWDQVLHYLVGVSPPAVDMAITAIKALQLHRAAE